MSYRISRCFLLAGSVSLLISSQSFAAGVDADAAKALAKDNGCFKCHAIDKAKKGPSYQKIAAKYKDKDKAEARDKLIKNITTAPMVKLEDGTEEEHKVIDTKDPKKIQNLVDWILSQ